MSYSGYLPRLALTVGEPAGIGVDITLQLAQHSLPAHLVAYGDPVVLAERAVQLGMVVRFDCRAVHEPTAHSAGTLKVCPVQTVEPVLCGSLNPANAAYVLEMLRVACGACVAGEFDALVTAPVHKGVINDAGFAFTGHTEFLAAETNTSQVVMLLSTRTLNVALATTHVPLRAVCDLITTDYLCRVLKIVYEDFKEKFGVNNPHILVCGLNPHAGENGHLGREEIEVIMPAIVQLQRQGLRLTGPVPADTAFTANMLEGVDVVLAMYHDQGLPVLKYQGFGEAVNVTLGLPIIRTSVDHGTALPLAGSGRASSASLLAAVHKAIEMVTRRRHLG